MNGETQKYSFSKTSIKMYVRYQFVVILTCYTSRSTQTQTIWISTSQLSTQTRHPLQNFTTLQLCQFLLPIVPKRPFFQNVPRAATAPGSNWKTYIQHKEVQNGSRNVMYFSNSRNLIPRHIKKHKIPIPIFHRARNLSPPINSLFCRETCTV